MKRSTTEQSSSAIDTSQTGKAGGESARSRRRFIQAATSASIVTTLAAQPVWGKCTVSGAVSGGSQALTDEVCYIPDLNWRSPGYWKNAGNGNNLLSAFPEVCDDDEDALRAAVTAAKAHVFDFKVENIDSTITEHSILVSKALAKELPAGVPGNVQGMVFNLAGIYLSAYFGFFGSASIPGFNGSPTAQDWVDHFNGLAYVFNDPWNALGEGTTSYTAGGSAC